MNKRITSLALVFTLILTLLATAVPALAAPSDPLCTFTVEADKTSANPGEEITYTISMEQTDTLTTFAFYLAIPSGLTYVADSAVLGETAVSRLGVTYEFVPDADLLLTWYDVNGNDYTYTDKLELMTFKCTVDSDAVIGQNYEVGLTLEGVAAGSTGDYDEITDKTAVVPVTITVTAAPKPATSIKLNKSTTTIYTGANETLIATVEPNDTTDTVTWTSSNTAVATVDTNGKVTAVATGTATITATAGSQSASCVVTVENAPCTHTNKTKHDEKSSTCKEKGWDTYFVCDDCGKLFDEDGNEISAIPYRSLADHTPAQTATTEYLKSEATCTSPAVYYEHCSVCDEKLSTTFTSGSTISHTESGWKSDADGHWKECTVCGTVTTTKVAHTPDHEGHATEEYAINCSMCGWEIEAQLGHTHNLTRVDGNPATCTTDGNEAYYVCSGCSKWFADATGSVEITDHSSVVIGKLGHDWVDATCTTPKACSRCDATEGTALGHEFADVWSSDASGHWHACSRCDAKDGEAAHTPDREAATETDPIKCTECDYIITAALGHTHSLTKVEANTPTCTEDGNIEYYTCSGCSKLFADATGNVEITVDKTVDKATGHQYEWVIDKEATATEKGSKHEECKVCHDKKAAVEIPATGTPTNPTNPENPDSPQTGDNSMMGLWIALLLVSGVGVAGTTIYGRKKKYSAK